MRHLRKSLAATLASIALASTACDAGTTTEESDGQANTETESEEAETTEVEEQEAQREAEQDAVEQHDGDVQEEPEVDPDPGPEPAPEPEALTLGESATVGDYEVTVTEFVADNTEWVLDGNQFNDPPRGGVYSTVTLDATYIGNESGMPSIDLQPTLVVDAVRHHDFECNASLPDELDAPTLENGGTAEDVTFCFDHPGVNSDTEFFVTDWLTERDRVYWDISS